MYPEHSEVTVESVIAMLTGVEQHIAQINLIRLCTDWQFADEDLVRDIEPAELARVGETEAS